MNNPSERLRNMRLDLSPYMFHFTDSLDTLWKILGELCLKSNKKEYVCFTETPLCLMISMLDYMGIWRKPILGKYGIGFKRDLLIQQYGARPVIYCDKIQQIDIGQTLKWLYEELNVEGHDFQWLREWRIKGEFDFSKIERNDILIIVSKSEETETCAYYIDNAQPFYDEEGNLFDADFDIKRLYRCLPLDKLRKVLEEKCIGDYDLLPILEQQIIDEIIEI